MLGVQVTEIEVVNKFVVIEKVKWKRNKSKFMEIIDYKEPIREEMKRKSGIKSEKSIKNKLEPTWVSNALGNRLWSRHNSEMTLN